MSPTLPQGPSFIVALEAYKDSLRTVVHLQHQRQQVAEQAVVLSDALVLAEAAMIRARVTLDEAIKRAL